MHFSPCSQAIPYLRELTVRKEIQALYLIIKNWKLQKWLDKLCLFIFQNTGKTTTMCNIWANIQFKILKRNFITLNPCFNKLIFSGKTSKNICHMTHGSWKFQYFNPFYIQSTRTKNIYQEPNLYLVHER